MKTYPTLSLCRPVLPLLLLPLLAGLLSAQSQSPVPSPSDLNAAFGYELWQDENLFDDEADATAKRLRWARESQTLHESSYRRYANQRESFLGVRPYSLALYASEGRVSQFSAILTNKGDVGGYTPGFISESLGKKERKAAEKAQEEKFEAFAKTLESDAQAVEAKLTALLGSPSRQNLGQGKEVRERVSRWNVGSQAILLCARDEEYIRVVVMPAEDADNGGRPARITTSALRDRLAKEMRREPNGDVLISEIPMVNQGNKGFCGPASLERVLRHLGTPVDMYVLAMAAGTEFGGGTIGSRLYAVTSELAKRSGRESGTCSLTMESVSKVLDQGVPLVWTMFIDAALEKQVKERSELRKGVTTAETAADWKQTVLDPLRKSDIAPVYPVNGHFRLIVGYNATTGEVAYSDSWGRPGETWIMIEEARAMDQPQEPLYYLAP